MNVIMTLIGVCCIALSAFVYKIGTIDDVDPTYTFIWTGLYAVFGLIYIFLAVFTPNNSEDKKDGRK